MAVESSRKEPSNAVAFNDQIPPDKQALEPSTKCKEKQAKLITNELTKEEKEIKWSILKNIIAISFSFSLLFTSFNSMSNLQSSLHQQLGTTALGMIYAGIVTSCAFLPTLIIKKLRPKWALALSMFLYSPYFAALFVPRYYTILPAGFLLGLAGAPLWASKCTYLTKVGTKYAALVGESSDVTLTKFFGIFFLFHQSSQVWGNLISSAVLSVGVKDFKRSDEFLQSCGINFCPEFGCNISSLSTPSTSEIEEVEEKDETKIFMITGMYLLLVLISALLVAVVVDPLSKYGIEDKEFSYDKKVKELLLATFQQMKNPYQILIIPLTIWSGLEQGFLAADFTSGFVTCYLGMHMVGYVLICFGVFDAVCSIGVTPLVKYFKRVPVFTLGATLNIAIILLLFIWKPDPSQPFLFFLVPTVWGMADAVWQTQINSLYGIIFPGKAEAAFSNYRLWESAGFILAFVMSGSLCMEAKLLTQGGSLLIGMAGYYYVELLEKRRKLAEEIC